MKTPNSIPRAVYLRSLIASGLLLGGVMVADTFQEFTSRFAPGTYTIPTLARARAEVRNLRNLMNSDLPVTEFQARIVTQAASNKAGMSMETESGTQVLDANSNSTDPALDGRDTSLDGLPDVPCIGYSVGDYTYAGFEPRSVNRHLDETRIAYAGKDWVYRYLLNNHIAPDDNWATAAAAALNQQYGTDEFKAPAGSLLVYGDEFVRSAPNGYGLNRGQYDPNAKGEFFWGAE